MEEIGVDETEREREGGGGGDMEGGGEGVKRKIKKGRTTATDEVQVKMLAVAERVGIW